MFFKQKEAVPYVGMRLLKTEPPGLANIIEIVGVTRDNKTAVYTLVCINGVWNTGTTQHTCDWEHLTKYKILKGEHRYHV